MVIEFECTGGYAGLKLSYVADTEDLDPALRERLVGLVEDAGVFELKPGHLAKAPAGPPDIYYYQLLLLEGDRRVTHHLSDVTAPKELRPLLAELRRLALEERRSGK